MRPPPSVTVRAGSEAALDRFPPALLNQEIVSLRRRRNRDPFRSAHSDSTSSSISSNISSVMTLGEVHKVDDDGQSAAAPAPAPLAECIGKVANSESSYYRSLLHRSHLFLRDTWRYRQFNVSGQ